MDHDALFASTPSLVTTRILVAMSFARNWGVKVCDASPAFLRAMIAEDIHVLPPVQFYPNGDCLWNLKLGMDGLRKSPKLWQQHFSEVLHEMICKWCKSDPNLYTPETGELYNLAYVDDLMIVGSEEMREAFIKEFSNRVL